MNRFQPENLIHIKERFQAETGIKLNTKKSYFLPKKAVILLATLLLCGLALTAFGFQRFSDLAGDELSIGASYQGKGIISIQVENQSDKTLHFQPKLKLMKWNSGEEIQPISHNLTFSNREIPAHSHGTMTIDLSAAYDIEALEQPLTDDSYYLVLTNNNFIFGQDWMCSVAFTENIYTPQKPGIPSQISSQILKKIPKELHFYFEADSTDTEARRKLDTAYKEAYCHLFTDFDGNIISSISPVLPGNKITSSIPYPHIKDPANNVIFDEAIPTLEQSQLITLHWYTNDSRFKLLATEGEYALVLSAALPLEKYKDASTDLPLFFLLCYEKDQTTDKNAYAFIYGQIIPFSQLEPYQVYENEGYVYYEVSPFIYTDLNTYLQDFAGQNPAIRLDEEVKKRVENIYQYYQENLPSLIYFP